MVRAGYWELRTLEFFSSLKLILVPSIYSTMALPVSMAIEGSTDLSSEPGLGRLPLKELSRISSLQAAQTADSRSPFVALSQDLVYVPFSGWLPARKI